MDPNAELRERQELLERIRPYALGIGLANVTVDGAAQAAGIAAERLREFFETKVDLVLALVADYRIRIRAKFADLDPSVDDETFRRKMWQFYLDTAAEGSIFYEAYGLALHDDHYREFFFGINDWIVLLKEAAIRRGMAKDRAEAFATLTLAVYRGAMMDVLGSGDRPRVNSAMELWFKAASFLSKP